MGHRLSKETVFFSEFIEKSVVALIFPLFLYSVFMQVSVWFPENLREKEGKESASLHSVQVSTHFQSLNANFLFIVGSFNPSNNF